MTWRERIIEFFRVQGLAWDILRGDVLVTSDLVGPEPSSEELWNELDRNT